MRRIMCLWLPQLPLDRRVRLGDPRTEGPFAIIADIKNAFRVTHATPAAISGGAQPGMSVPDARAVLPELLTELADPVRENLLLKALTRWAGKLSPWVAPLPPDCLVLDITGCAHLMGGEEAMARHTWRELKDMQITARIGLADTKRAAMALARFGQARINRAGAGQTRPALAKLPIAALGLARDTQNDLHRTGLKTLGQLYGFKSSDLARRFGLELPQHLAKALGHHPDPVCPIEADPVFAARMSLPTPIGLKSDVDLVLGRLIRSVCERLKRDEKGARRFDLTLRCVDTGEHALSIGFARPCHDGAAVQRQFDHPIDQLSLEFGADWFRLSAARVEPLRPQQPEMLTQLAGNNGDMDQLITTLGNRLGFDRVQMFAPGDSHIPERAFVRMDAAECAAVSDWPKPGADRPVRLFAPEPLHVVEPGRPPRIFEWRRQRYETDVFAGPERLYPEWWSQRHGRVRDYWQISSRAGDRLWLLTYPGQGDGRWYMAGRFV